MSSTPYGTKRVQVFCRPTRPEMREGQLVRLMKSPRWGVRPVKAKEVPFGITKEFADSGVWVTTYGPCEVKR